MKVSYILLDVCDTLVNFQTANAFTEYVIKKKFPLRRFQLFLFRKIFNNFILRKILIKLGFSLKLMQLSLIKGIQKDELNELAKRFFKQMILPSLNNDVLDFLKQYKSADVIIVSGGYDIYLRFLAEYIDASYLIASELDFSSQGKFTGNLKGVDCMGINKVIKLFDAGLLDKLKFEETAVLSDSISDLPLFSLGKYKIAVNPDRELKKLIGKGWYSIKEVLR
jgi:HAD superfamily hydrolase (TIGR01490 family)